MTDDGAAQSTTQSPLPKFLFEVKWDDHVMHFQEVTGLDVDSQAIEYRHGDSPTFSVIKMPGVKKYSDVVMKKGIFKNDNKFIARFNAIKMNNIKRSTITISLLDESGAPAMVWTLLNAWPNKIIGTDPKSTDEEVAVEAITISHEGLTIANG